MHTSSKTRRLAIVSPALAWCTLVFASSPLPAQTIVDPTFGLSVTPPSGYMAQLWTPMPSRNVIIVVQRTEFENAGCIVEFLSGASSATDTQADVNARSDNAESVERLRSELAARYEIHSIAPIEHAGVRGTAIVGERHVSLPVPASAIPKKMREWYVILDTLKGRTTVNCETYRYEFSSRFPDFNALVRSIAFPK